MLTISKPLSLGQARDYYRHEYTSNVNYYSAQAETAGVWRGRLAAEWGLHGAVTSEQYERLCAGQHPATGAQLIRHVAAHTYTNTYGAEITTQTHRVGWDMTFSAPKSVSLATLAGGDERLREAHRAGVEAALEVVEQHTYARLGGNRPAHLTGRCLAACFEHDAARPDQLNSYAAPQLHTHVVVFNLTKDGDGPARAVQPLEWYRSQRVATEVYRAVLAEQLQQLGYEIEVDGRTGAPEIKGFSAEYLQASSPRSAEVSRTAAEMKARLAQEGVSVKEGAGLRQAAARADRAGKQYDRAAMSERVQELEAAHGHQAQQLVQQALARGPYHYDAARAQRQAQEAVIFARDHATEREAVVDRRQLLAAALRRNLGRAPYDAVRQELAAREARGEILTCQARHRPARSTSARMLEMEKAGLERLRQGQGILTPVLAPENATEAISAQITKHGRRLNEGQQRAMREILTSRDQFVGLQGGAGTGKTTTLSVLREVAQEAGYEVQGLAPTTRAAQALAESGLATRTLAKFLRETPQAHRPTLYVLDESSLAGTRSWHHFLARLETQDRVLLVGDARQHQAVEAGSPFAQWQQHGLQTAHLTEIVRQRDASLKRAVTQLAAREVRAAVAQLREDGRVTEIKQTPARLRAIAQDYAAQPQGTLVIAPSNRERVTLNALIREELQAAGQLGAEDYRTQVYVTRQEMTGAERTFAHAYQPGQDVVRFSRASKVYGVAAGEYAPVVSVNAPENLLTVLRQNGETVTYNPARLSGVSVYREEERAFAVGDRVQLRAPWTGQRLANGELGVITGIDPEKECLSLLLDNQRRVTVDLQQFRHLEHGYAVTSYAAQGHTVERVLLHADTNTSELLLNQRLGYVAVSRARHEAHIYTNDAEALGHALERQVNKETAYDSSGWEGQARGEPDTSAALKLTRKTERALAQEVTVAQIEAGIEIAALL